MKINYAKFIRAIIVLILIIAFIIFIISKIIGAITGGGNKENNEESTNQEYVEETNYENIEDVIHSNGETDYYEEVPLSREETLLNALKNNIALSNDYVVHSDEEMRTTYDISDFPSAFGFVIIDKTKDTYTEIAVINLNNEENLDAVQNTVLSKMIQRNEVIKDENKNQYGDLFKNRSNFLMKIQNGVAVFVVSTQKDAIEKIIDDNYIN